MFLLWFSSLWVVLFLYSCSVPVSSAPIGGSRADGTITVAYEYGALTVPEVNRNEMDRQAKERCGRWGYEEAERFGGETRQCTRPDGSGCWRWLVSVQYQCITPATP